PLYWHFPGYLGAGTEAWRTTPGGAIRDGDWKLLEFFEGGRLELYNLRDDTGERRNLAREMPERVKELHARLVTWRERIGAPRPRPRAASDDAPVPAPKPQRAKKKAARRPADGD